MSENLEDHADVGPVHAADLEVVQELNTPFAIRISLVTFANLRKKSIKKHMLGCADGTDGYIYIKNSRI